MCYVSIRMAPSSPPGPTLVKESHTSTLVPETEQQFVLYQSGAGIWGSIRCITMLFIVRKSRNVCVLISLSLATLTMLKFLCN